MTASSFLEFRRGTAYTSMEAIIKHASTHGIDNFDGVGADDMVMSGVAWCDGNEVLYSYTRSL
jgi:hypothetical protein